ncbi:MAG: hypothetical protein BRC33_11180 [Cyanobacteria bacterium SW_9_44_58]|nr:MAG: hypothetical protein BRC33_11180 [Cyanobacteria bacterium SW_9_44_58]
MNTITLENVIEYIENLSIEEQEELFELIKKRRIERRRSEIAENAKKTFETLEQGTAVRGNVQELKSYLSSDEEE